MAETETLKPGRPPNPETVKGLRESLEETREMLGSLREKLDLNIDKLDAIEQVIIGHVTRIEKLMGLPKGTISATEET